MKLVAFDINEYARIKPSPAVVDLWKTRRRELIAAFPRLPWAVEMPLDADGFYRDQLWVIMALVGPECIAGGSVCENGTLYLEMKP